MRILHIDAGRSLRGGQWQALELARALERRGHRNVFLARAGSPMLEKAAAGLEAHPLSPITFKKYAISADLIHCHDARSHTWAALGGAHPLVVSRRVAFPIRGSWASQWKYRRADRFVAVSHYVAQRLREAGVPDQKIRVVYDGFRLEQAVRMSTLDSRTILAPSTADPRKGSALAVEATHGLDLQFSAHLPADLPSARIFLYLTWDEGLGSACLLAMALGVPVVASRVGGLPEIVRHEETGLLVENSPAAVRAALDRLLNDPALSRRLADGARELAYEKYTIDRTAEQTLAVYRELVP